ncbi:MAG: hypothetical protein ABSE82_15135 [Nitrososphaerales archaeon]|jgi:hypothetical protein
MVNEGTPEVAITKQREFLEDVFLSNVLSAALVIRKGRRVFKDTPTPLESAEREEFRGALKSELLKLAKRYSSAVEEEVHIDNIRGLAKDLSDTYGKLLDGDLLLGRAQKALNLYLKYLWCEGLIVCPPHCPFDNDVISALRKLLPKDCERRWTHADKADTYREWVKAAKVLAEKKGQSLSEWELEVWAAAQVKLKAAQARNLAKLKAQLADSALAPKQVA